MANEDILSNLGIIAIIIPVIIFQLKRFCDSKKPELQSSASFNVVDAREHIDEDVELKNRYYKKTIVYYSVYLLPMLIALLTCLIFFNIAIGLSFFIAGIVAIVLSVIITKNWN